jgi:hypothetical protein
MLSTDAWLVQAADRSLAETMREEARHAPGGIVLEEEGMLLCLGSRLLPTNPNAVMRLEPGLSADEVLTRADAFYGEGGAGYSLHLRLGSIDDDLARAASKRQPLLEVAAPAMVVEGRLDVPPMAGPVTIDQVEDSAGAVAYAHVVDDAYQSLGWPAGEPAAVFESPSLLLQPSKVAFVAWSDGTPVAAAYVAVNEGLGLVSWVGTVSSARGRGLAAAVTVAATNAGFDLDAHAVWLEASAMGEPVYRRLGFREFGRTRTVILWPRPHDKAVRP